MGLYPIFLAIFSVGFFVGGLLTSLLVLTVTRQYRLQTQKTLMPQTDQIQENLALLPNNEQLINWRTTSDATNTKRSLDKRLPELIPGPLMMPLRPQETLLFADEMSLLHQREPAVLPQMPFAPQSRAS
jgi:hypothetical protein